MHANYVKKFLGAGYTEAGTCIIWLLPNLLCAYLLGFSSSKEIELWRWTLKTHPWQELFMLHPQTLRRFKSSLTKHIGWCNKILWLLSKDITWKNCADCATKIYCGITICKKKWYLPHPLLLCAACCSPHNSSIPLRWIALMDLCHFECRSEWSEPLAGRSSEAFELSEDRQQLYLVKTTELRAGGKSVVK